MKTETAVTIQGRKLTLSNLEKVLYPEAGFTKSDVINYYVRVAPALLPHLRDRPLTLKRYPEGVRGAFFYEKRCPPWRPPWVKTAPVWSRVKQQDIEFCLANDVPSLVWAANLADLELHVSLAKYRRPDRPLAMVFDLDPGAPATVKECARVALYLREALSGVGLEAFPKTSGSKGLQLYVPLNTPCDFKDTKSASRALAERIQTAHPNEVVVKMSKALRPGKVLIDWSQNDRHKTTVCAYSLRAREQPTVSTPLTWTDVEAAEKSRQTDPLVFTAPEVLSRVQQRGDLFEPVLTMKQRLPRELLGPQGS